METTSRRPIAVCDAGPLIHLGELNSLGSLSDFDLWVPEAVWNEVQRHFPAALHRPDLAYELRYAEGTLPPSLAALRHALSLDVGEVQGLSIMARLPKSLFLTDDAAARLAAHQLGYRVHGTIGILIRSIRRGQLSRDEVVAELRAVPTQSSLHIRPSLLEEVIEQLSRNSA